MKHISYEIIIKGKRELPGIIIQIPALSQALSQRREPGTTKLYCPNRLRGKGRKKERERYKEREREREEEREREREKED